MKKCKRKAPRLPTYDLVVLGQRQQQVCLKDAGQFSDRNRVLRITQRTAALDSKHDRMHLA
jgi:hypothetical protein